SGDVWSSVAASVSADGRLEIIGDVSGAELLRATFAGRTLGDVTGDGTVNAYDPLRISRSLAGLITLDEDQVFYADVTGEGTLNAYDSLRISRHLAGIVDEHYGVTP
ncbi:MAG: dockerin type I repeat-containing protein, partial [Methanoculleus sp.]